jgi:hypothetical protein
MVDQKGGGDFANAAVLLSAPDRKKLRMLNEPSAAEPARLGSKRPVLLDFPRSPAFASKPQLAINTSAPRWLHWTPELLAAFRPQIDRRNLTFQPAVEWTNDPRG